MDGVLVIDKPEGPTSHDVVARMRKAMGTRAVGHAGTLDPLASGVLVIAIGQATKLVPHLTSHMKGYEATVAFGTSTTTLDREGDVVARAEVPERLVAEQLSHALDVEMARSEQIPPVFSAIKQGGRSVHKLARRGEEVVLAPRPVRLLRASVLEVTSDAVRLSLDVSKGYYVRSLARDLGMTMGVPSHLAALRRVFSGPFTLAEALSLDTSPEALRAGMRTLAETARRVLPTGELNESGVRRARFGQLLTASDFVVPPEGGEGTSAWFDPWGCLVAIGRAVAGVDGGAAFSVDRGFPQATSSEST